MSRRNRYLWIVLGVGIENKALGFDLLKAYATDPENSDGDRAYLTGSTGYDQLVMRPNYTYLKSSSPGYYVYAAGFDLVEADVEGSGGFDRLFAYDTPGLPDTFLGTPDDGRMLFAAVAGTGSP